MPHLAQWAVSLCIAVVTVILYRWYQRQRSRLALTQRYGCEAYPKYPHEDRIWGYDLIRLRQRAGKDGKLMALYEKQFAAYGKTWEENFLGARVINTMQPENIQQVATASFGDYARNAGGKNVGWPFLGKGITTTDGEDWRHSRGLVKPTFARSELSDIEGLSTFVDRLIERVPEDGSSFDIQPLLHKMVCT